MIDPQTLTEAWLNALIVLVVLGGAMFCIALIIYWWTGEW